MGEREGGGGEGKPQMQNFIEETHPKRPTTTNPFHSIPKSYEFYFTNVMYLYTCVIQINVPNYRTPSAFSPSLSVWNGDLLLPQFSEFKKAGI